MSTTTPLAQEIAKLSPRLRAERLATEDCELHGRPAAECEPCAAARLEQERDEEQREVLEAAGRCWEKFPPRYQQATTDRPDVLAWVAQFHADPASAPSLLLLGPTGVGKTYQAYGAVRAAVTVALPTRAGGYRSPRWQGLTYADLCASLRPRGRDHDPEAQLERYRAVELLFIDDLGAAKTSEFVEETTYRLINGRYEDMRPSIFTSNLGLSELKDTIGDRIASRLAETCTRVVLEGPDRRRSR
jgi:DNA replication protein DnaC